MRTLKVPNYVQIARSKKVSIDKVFNPAVVSWRQRISDLSAFCVGTSSFSHTLWLDAAEPNKPQVFHVQIRSPFAGRRRQVVETAPCPDKLLILKASAFHRRRSCWTPGMLGTASVPRRAQSVAKRPSKPSEYPAHRVTGHSTQVTEGATESGASAHGGPGSRSKGGIRPRGRAGGHEARRQGRGPTQ